MRPFTRQKLLFFAEASHSLFFYGAAGLVALGLYLNLKMGIPASFYPVLWFAGSLLIYNLDRYVPDAADRINLPARAPFRQFRKWIISVCLVVLIVPPLYDKQWLLLGLLLVALTVSSFYTLRPPGFPRRIKDVLFLKCLLPPTVILATLTIPSWIHPHEWPRLLHFWPLLGNIFMALLTNILLFDQRDHLGDHATGLQTMATRLAPTRFFYLLLALQSLQFIFLLFDPRPELILLTLYTALIVLLARQKKSAGFYHWAVDGLLFIPLLGCQLIAFWK